MRDESALEVMKGIEAPPSINPHFRRAIRPPLDPGQLLGQLKSGDRSALARAITLVENPENPIADEVLQGALALRRDAYRIGISGPPGVGKSTLIEQLGMHLIAQGHRVAVLAVDPSSIRSHGSILGDKSRMPKLAQEGAAFIRPSPSGLTPGGVSQATRDAITLCEAAGFDIVLVETVGVGQGEVAVYQMTDCFLVLLPSGAGDEMQGIKRGIIELADVITITKADGDRVEAAETAAVQVRSALHWYGARPGGWMVPVLLHSSKEERGTAELWSTLCEFQNHQSSQGMLDARRMEQRVAAFQEELTLQAQKMWQGHPSLGAISAQVQQGKLSIAEGVRRILSPEP